jgi:trk system potassium uptake protein TrkA
VQIIIVGGGLVGTTLAEKLSGDGHDVSLVESDRKGAAELSATLDVRIVEGNGATAPTLRRAGAGDASLVVATTDSDEVNFVTGRIAASMFKVPRVVVRLRDPDHEEAFHELSRVDAVEIFCVNPEAAAVDKVASLLEVPSALDVVSFMDGELLVAGFRITENSEFAERPVSDMDLFFAGTSSLVAAIHRGDRTVVPHGGEEIRAGDIVYFAIERTDLEGVLELMGTPPKPQRRVMIAGATRIGLDLARRLEGSGSRVTIIDADADRARRAADSLDSALVISGLVTSEKLLHEAEIERVDTFVAVTADHETNLVACLLTKRLGAGRTFALVDNPALANLIGETAIDAIISPRLLAIGLILQHIPGARVHSMAALLGDRVEVMEAEAVKGSRLVSGPLSDVSLPRGVLVGALRRNGALLVPGGTDRVEPGDRVLLIAATKSAAKLTEFLTN